MLRNPSSVALPLRDALGKHRFSVVGLCLSHRALVSLRPQNSLSRSRWDERVSTVLHGWRNGDWIPLLSDDLYYGMIDAHFLIYGVEHCITGEDWGKHYAASGDLTDGPSEIFIPFVSRVVDSDPYNEALFHPYYSQITVCAGLLGTIRVGVNPGEFIDFVLGLTTYDLFDDDEATKGNKFIEGSEKLE